MSAVQSLNFRKHAMRTIIEFPDDQPDALTYASVLCLEHLTEGPLQAVLDSDTKPKIALRALPTKLAERLLPNNIRFFVETALEAPNDRVLLPVHFRGELVSFVLLYRSAQGLAGVTAGPAKEINKRTAPKFIGTEGHQLLKCAYEQLVADDGSPDVVTVSA